MNEMIQTLFYLQVGLPLALILANTLLPSASRTGLLLRSAALLALLQYAALTGIWLFPPWWTPYALMGLLLLGMAWRWGRRTRRRSMWIKGMEVGLATLVLCLAGVMLLPAHQGRAVPAEVIDLAMPLGPGRYLVASGGTTRVINAHLIPLPPARAAEFTGQAHAVDIVGIDRFGLQAPGDISPADPKAYAIYGAPVLAPCTGQVAQVIDGVADMPVPQMDRANMTGNSVMLECDGFVVLLAHLAPGSIAVTEGEDLVTGTRIGAVGNTGNSGAPHLHIHVQRGLPEGDPLASDSLWFTLEGAFYVRNDRFVVPAADASGS